MRMLATIILSGATAVLGIAACGGSDSGDDLVADANRICTDNARQIAAANLKAGVATDLQSNAQVVEATLPARRRAVDQLAQLDPPDDQASDWSAFMKARRAAIPNFEKEIEAAKAGDQDRFNTADDEIVKANDEAEQTAAKIGIAACARQLPADDRNATLETLTKLETTDDPKLWCEPQTGPVTEQFVEGLGGQGACEARLRRLKGDVATDVKVSQVKGVDNVNAQIGFEDVGGHFDGQPATATFYYLNGKWLLVNAIIAG